MIRRAVDEYLARADSDTATWREHWAIAVEKTAGAAPSLAEGSEYVEDLRRHDAERLSDLDP
jgi:ribulose-5-phosphate 4-epimerase/fuculose-1-phosphate aldolase